MHNEKCENELNGMDCRAQMPTIATEYGPIVFPYNCQVLSLIYALCFMLYANTRF